MGQGKRKETKSWTVRPNKKLTPKKKRPNGKGGGFIALVTGFVGICCWTLWGAVNNEKLRMRLASKPIVFSQHASCRMDCR
jgi:hypothetical protein